MFAGYVYVCRVQRVDRERYKIPSTSQIERNMCVLFFICILAGHRELMNGTGICKNPSRKYMMLTNQTKSERETCFFVSYAPLRENTES